MRRNECRRCGISLDGKHQCPAHDAICISCCQPCRDEAPECLDCSEKAAPGMLRCPPCDRSYDGPPARAPQRQSVTGSRRDLRVDGLGDARRLIREARDLILADGVGPNGRDRWTPERVARWHNWAADLARLEDELCTEQIVVCDEP